MDRLLPPLSAAFSLCLLGVACGNGAVESVGGRLPAQISGSEDAAGKADDDSPDGEGDPRTDRDGSPVAADPDGNPGAGDENGQCTAGFGFALEGVGAAEVDLPDNPLGLDMSGNRTMEAYFTDFRVLAAQGYAAYNDAEAYGVRILPADVAPGQLYWKVIGVHHLLPNENRSKHHLYIEALDEEGTQIRASDLNAFLFADEAGDAGDELRLDKPLNEPSGNHAMYYGARNHVGMSRGGGMVGLPTERASGIHTQHADEPLPNGDKFNTYGHHSFYVVFQLTRRLPREVRVDMSAVDAGSADFRLLGPDGSEAAGLLEKDVLVFRGLPGSSYDLHAGSDSVPLAFEPSWQAIEVAISPKACAGP